jgi:hypothetical protein
MDYPALEEKGRGSNEEQTIVVRSSSNPSDHGDACVLIRIRRNGTADTERYFEKGLVTD